MKSCRHRPHLAVRASCGAVTTRRNNMSSATTTTTTTTKPIALFLNASRLDYDRQLGTFVCFLNDRPRRTKSSQPTCLALLSVLKTDSFEYFFFSNKTKRCLIYIFLLLYFPVV